MHLRGHRDFSFTVTEREFFGKCHDFIELEEVVLVERLAEFTNFELFCRIVLGLKMLI